MSETTVPVNNPGQLIDNTGNLLSETQNRQAEQNTAAASLAHTVEYLPIMAWIASGDGAVLYMNSLWNHTTGQAAEDTAGWGWLNMIHPDDRQIIESLYKEQIAAGKPYEDDCRIYHSATGGYTWYKLKCQPCELNGAKGWMGVCMENQEFHSLNEELEYIVAQRTAQLNEAQAIAHVGSFDWYIPTNYLYWSDELYRLFGYEPGMVDIDLDMLMSCVLPESREAALAYFNTSLAVAEEMEFVLWISKQDNGEKRALQIRLKVIPDQQGITERITGTAHDITERLEAETALILSKELSENILRNSIDSICSWDRELRYTTWNEATEKLTGIKKEDALGKSLYELYPSTAGSEIEQIFKRVLDGKQVHVHERRLFSAEERYYEAWFMPMFDLQNEVTGGINIVHDVTERKLAEEQIKAEMEFRETLLNHSVDVILSFDRDYKVTLWNKKAAEVIGLSSAEVVGKTLQEVLDAIGAYEDFDYSIFERVLAGESININRAYSHIPGHHKISYLPIRNENNEVSGGLIIVHDITEKMESITQLKETQEHLLRSEAMLAEAQKQAHMGSWEWSAIDNSVFWSDELYRIYGLAPQSQRVTMDTYLGMVPESQREYVLGLHRECVVNRTPFEFEHEIIKPDGTVRIVAGQVRPVTDQEGRVIKMSGYTQDVTERREAELSLQLKNEELSRSNHELEQFAYVASHDLKEPLRMISSYTQLLWQKYGSQMNEDAKEYIEYAREGAFRMSALINDLLEYSRIGRIDAGWEKVDTTLAVEDALYNLKVLIDESGTILNYSGLPVIMHSALHTTQLFQNLISNAIKFRSEQQPVIEISCIKAENEWVFCVKDNGIGMDETHQDKIFLIFQRLHTRDKYPGTGVGLAICKKIVEQRGGRIWVESQPGQGSSFYFTVPFN